MWRVLVVGIALAPTRVVAADPEPARSPMPPTMCESDVLEHDADDGFARGMFTFALDRYEKALRCNARIGLVFKAGLAACVLHRESSHPAMADKAKLYYRHLPQLEQALLAFVCQPLVLE